MATNKTTGIYIPPRKTLEKYADVLVNFALGGGKGVQKDDTVRIAAGECAKPLFIELRKAVLRAGGHVISNYQPDDDSVYSPSRDFFDCAQEHQLNYFPKKYLKGLAEEIDHNIVVIGDKNKRALENIDPKKIMQYGETMKPMKKWLDEKEAKGNFTWTLGLFGTYEMAKEAGLTERQYWNQIIKACFLDHDDPVAKWKEVSAELEKKRKKLDSLDIDTIHVEGDDVDLRLRLGEKRKWQGGSGRNIPSFELFTSPDWRGTEGWIRFNQPLYRYGNIIDGIELEFEGGRVKKSKAKKNEKVLRSMIETEGADKVGEFSLTDSRYSRITKFMAETLYDENFGGQWGNTHIALGNAYKDCYAGDASRVKKATWKKLGFNESSVHTDMISTTNRTVTATLKNGKTKKIYEDGQFVI